MTNDSSFLVRLPEEDYEQFNNIIDQKAENRSKLIRKWIRTYNEFGQPYIPTEYGNDQEFEYLESIEERIFELTTQASQHKWFGYSVATVEMAKWNNQTVFVISQHEATEVVKANSGARYIIHQLTNFHESSDNQETVAIFYSLNQAMNFFNQNYQSINLADEVISALHDEIIIDSVVDFLDGETVENLEIEVFTHPNGGLEIIMEDEDGIQSFREFFHYPTINEVVKSLKKHNFIHLSQDLKDHHKHYIEYLK